MKRKLYAYMALAAILFYYLSGNAQHIGSPGKQTAVYRDYSKGIPYGYWEYLPQNYDTSPNSTTTYPVVIFFGGTGQIGNGTTDLTKMLNTTAPPKIIKNGRHFPAIVISAQHSGWFDEPQSKELYDYITKTYPVDSNRVYVTGLSAGGSAAWKFGRAYPELPAAIVPIAGATRFTSPQTQMKQISIWAIHNVGDGYPSGGIPSVFTMYNCDEIANIPGTVRSVYPGGWGWGKTAGFDVTMHFMDDSYWDADTGVVEPKQKMAITMYDAFGHNGWGKAYNSNYLWDWMFAQSRNGSVINPPPPPPQPTDSVVVRVGQDVQLNLPINEYKINGSAYSLIGSAISSYHWTKESGPTVAMSGISTPSLTLQKLNSGTYTFVLSASSSTGAYNRDTVVIHVNASPLANAGLDQFIYMPQDSTILDGSMSSDPENNALSYQWKLIGSKLHGDTDTTVVHNPVNNAAYRVFVNFTPSWIKGNAPWNNLSGSINAGTKLLNMVDDSSNLTGIDLEFTVGWNGSKDGGQETGNNSGVYPDNVVDGFYWFQNRTPQIKLSGMDTSKTYKFKFFASRTGAQNKTTVYQIGNKLDSVDAAQNTQDLAVLHNIKADPNGEIIIDIRTGAGATYGYLNAIEIEAAPSSNISAPSSVITVTPPALTDSTRYFVNFTPSWSQVGKPWNNFNGNVFSGTMLKNLNDESSQSSNISIELMTTWNGTKLGGKLTGNNSGYFDDDVINGFYWFNNKTGQQIKVTGLNPKSTYDFTFMGSRNGWGNNKMSVYEINGKKDSVEANNNTSDVAKLKDLTPNSKGELIINISLAKGSVYGYLNAMVINEKSGKANMLITQPGQAQCLVTGLSKGQYTFELTVEDDQQMIDKDTVTVMVGSGSSSRLAANNQQDDIMEPEMPEFSVYPNPTIDFFNIQSEGLMNAEIQLLDIQGRAMKVDISKTEYNATINVADLPKGYYIIRVIKGNSSKAARVVVAPR